MCVRKSVRSEAGIMSKRTHFLHRFWAVVNERVEIWPHTVRYSRGRSIVAFQSQSDYGTWRKARAKGFRLARVQIKIIK
jgi:hypothetical protein